MEGDKSSYIVLEKIESVVCRLPSNIRGEALFRLIDSDDSGYINKRELEQLMVQGGSTTASACMSADKLFSQANMGNMKQVTLEQFLQFFEHEKVRLSLFWCFFLLSSSFCVFYLHFVIFSTSSNTHSD